jgi:hypothetical protein
MMGIVLILCCLSVAFASLYWTAVKSNKILFYDKCDSRLKGEFLLVSAGSTDKNKRAANLCLSGNIIDRIDEFDKLLVDGNSMKKFGIQSGDMVLVNKNYNKDELSAQTNAIITLKIQPKSGQKIEYKIRKFIDFYDFNQEPDFNKWLEDHHPVLAKDKSAWEDKKTGKDKRKEMEDYLKELIKDDGYTSRLVLSETSLKKRWYLPRIVHYSIHSESLITGKVQYKIPGSRVYVLNKI